jgi:hypothetical protein
MMSEKALWSLVRNNLPLKMYRVENRVMVGMPDVYFIRQGRSGWFEMKFAKDFKSGRRVSVGLKKHQHLWLKDYINHGGLCWILLRVGRTWLMLFKGDEDLVNKIKPSELIEKAVWHHKGIMQRENWKSLEEVMKNGRKRISKENSNS